MASPAKSTGSEHGPRKPNRMEDDRYPGDPERPGTFLYMNTAQKKVAAYLGLGHTSLLRQLVLTWPVIKAFVAFDQVAERHRKLRTVQLIRDQEEEIFQANRFEKRPLESQVEHKTANYHAASILLHMEADIKAYLADEAATKNIARSEHALVQLGQHLGLPVPALCMGCPAPGLGPLETESRLESINRCWVFLRLLKNTLSRKRWEQTFGSEESVLTGKEVTVSDAPRWMQDLNNTTPILISHLSSFTLPNSLTSSSQTVVPTATTSATGPTEASSAQTTTSSSNSPPNLSRSGVDMILQGTMSLSISAPVAPEAGLSAPSDVQRTARLHKAVATIDTSSTSLPPHSVTIRIFWEVNRPFDGMEELEYFLEYCRKRDIKLPDKEQIMHLNPMEVPDRNDFNARVCQMYSCSSLGLEIHSMILAWRNANGATQMSAMRKGWESTQKAMMNPTNTGFFLRVVLRCVGNAGHLVTACLKAQAMAPKGKAESRHKCPEEDGS